MKDGQFQVQFNWIFVLIAGALILLFFGSIVFKQKEISEKKISVDVIKTLESIIAGSSLSENTFNTLDIPKTNLEFVCDEDGTSFYKISDTGISISSETTPLFSPSKTSSSRLYTWTINFESPFKVIDALALTSSDVKYFFITGDASWRDSIESQLPSKLNFEFVEDTSKIDPLGFNKIRLIFKGVDPVITPNLNTLQDEDLTALKVSSSDVIFYKKKGSALIEEISFPLLSSFTSRDIFLLTAVFSDSGISYRCNINKLFKRGSIISEIYKKRAEKILTGDCSAMIDTAVFDELITGFDSCQKELTPDCTSIHTSALKIAEFNDNLQKNSCPLIY